VTEQSLRCIPASRKPSAPAANSSLDGPKGDAGLVGAQSPVRVLRQQALDDGT
jgi:hypothetical protein